MSSTIFQKKQTKKPLPTKWLIVPSPPNIYSDEWRGSVRVWNERWFTIGQNLHLHPVFSVCWLWVYGEVMEQPRTHFSYWEVEIIVLTLQGYCHYERNCIWNAWLTARSERSPQYMLGTVGGCVFFFFFLIVGQLLWKQSFLLLEITCIKVLLTSHPLSNPLQFEILYLWDWQRSPVTVQLLASVVFDIMGLLFLLKMLSSLAFMDFLFDLFTSSSRLNPKCWCSFPFYKFLQAASSRYAHRVDYCL